MKLEVGMYVRGKYYQYRGKIGKIIKNYNNDLEIAYKDGVLKTNVGSFIDDNYDINGKQYKASYNIIDILEEGDYVNGVEIIKIYEKGDSFTRNHDYIFTEKTIEVCNDNYELIPFEALFTNNEIETIVTHEQMEQMEYKVE